MPAFHPMKKHMEKLDEWGSASKKKYTAVRDAGPSASISDRFNTARGKDDRWERTKPQTAEADEDQTNIVPQRTARVGAVPQAPANFAVNKGRPPPPPIRTMSSTSACGPPAAPPRARAPGPPLPRRMDNENGIDQPPPSYGVTAQSLPAARSNDNPSYLEFSKFTEEDKQDFFDLLDEFFALRNGAASSSAGKSSSAGGKALHSANLTSFVQIKATRDPPKPTGPGAKPSVFPSVKPQPLKQSSPTSASEPTFPRLSASHLPSSELCSALQCSTFLCYPDSYPEWSGSQPWFVKPNAVPSSIADRNDVMRTGAWMSSGNNVSLLGCALFADLSYLWWKISWDSNHPAITVKSQVAYREPPSTWNDEERLAEASKGFGEWIAGFAETNAANQTPVGDGECWTLAADAIKYTNETAQLTESNRLMRTVGRTHGFLLYAGKADEVQGQCGRWRGGDRIRANGGGVRRGDIVEWRTVKIGIKGGAPGSWATLGAPDHTAIIVEDSPAPERLSRKKNSNAGQGHGDFYSVLGVARTATQSEIRSSYLKGARQHHPDKQAGVDDDYIQRLNEAHATLSNAALRSQHDDRLRGQGSTSNSSRVTAEVDLDSFEAVESVDDVATFHYPCRCGGGFYIDAEQLQNGREVIACSGCSEQIRVLWQDGQAREQDDNLEDEQPALSPWELDSITVIEQSAGKVPTRCSYDLSQKSFTKGEIWIYRPVWESEYLGGPPKAEWPPTLPGWEQLM